MLEDQLLESPTRKEYEAKMERLKEAVQKFKSEEEKSLKNLKLSWKIQLTFSARSRVGFLTRLAVWYIMKVKQAKFERDFKLKDKK